MHVQESEHYKPKKFSQNCGIYNLEKIQQNQYAGERSNPKDFKEV